jgi:xylulokinase
MLIGLDVGTTAARAVVIDLNGRLVASASQEYPLLMPQAGWTEQDPDAWWAASQSVLRKVTRGLEKKPLGLGLAGQMHGSVFLDSADQVIRPALLWNDQRTARQCAEITELVGVERLISIAGNPALTGFQAPKILWLRDEEPAAYERVTSVLLPKDYVRLKLTGDKATDASDASGTLLLDLRTRDWSHELLDRLNLRLEWLPKVLEGPDVSGSTRKTVAEATGVAAGVPVAAGGSDNAAAAIGNAIIREGVVSSSVGTSGVVFADCETMRVDLKGRVHAFCHAVPQRYHVMGVTLSAGGSLRWWRDVVAPADDYDALAARAAQAPAGSEGLLFLPYISGERTPHLDPRARGAFIGLQLRHSAAHMARAVMEGVVYSLKDCLDLIAEMGVAIDRVIATGGGARNPVWRQLQADVFGVPVYRNKVDEGPALGAALLAGVAAGSYRDLEDACSHVEIDPEPTRPDPQRHQLYRRYHAAFAEAYAATAPLMHRLDAISTD